MFPFPPKSPPRPEFQFVHTTAPSFPDPCTVDWESNASSSYISSPKGESWSIMSLVGPSLPPEAPLREAEGPAVPYRQTFFRKIERGPWDGKTGRESESVRVRGKGDE
jgi:hypothetical protein